MLIQTAVKKRLSTVELSALYDRTYDIADRLIKKHNPCNIHIKTLPAKDLYFNPIFPNELITDTYCNSSHSRGQLCCMGCKYWNKGCTVKALGCKLFLCYPARRESPILSKKLYRLKDRAQMLGLPSTKYYLPKEKWLKQMEKATHEIL